MNHKNDTEQVVENKSVPETRQEVSQDEKVKVDSSRCITRMATVHGEKNFYLSDGSVVADPSGIGFCP